jgi:hypothetical protein
MEHEQYFKKIDKIQFEKIREEVSKSSIVRYLYSIYHSNSAYNSLIEGTIETGLGIINTKEDFEQKLFDTFWLYERQVTSKIGIYGDVRCCKKTTNMIKYIITHDQSALDSKSVSYPINRINYMTDTQKLNYNRWFGSKTSMTPDIATTTLYVIPNKYDKKMRKIVKRLGFQSDFMWINSLPELKKTTWGSFYLKPITCIIWNLFNELVKHIDALRFMEINSYGFSRVVFDQIEPIWTSKNTAEPCKFYMVPCQFTWFIDSSLLKVFETEYETQLLPIEYSKYIYHHNTNYEDYIEIMVQRNIDCIMKIYRSELNIRRDNVHFDALRDSREVTSESYDSQCYPDKIDFHMTLREKTDLAKEKNYSNSCISSLIHEKIREIIMKHLYSPYTECDFKFDDIMLHTWVYSSYYPEQEITNNNHGWIVECIKETINNFIFSSNTYKHSALETGIFTNNWHDQMNYISKRFSTVVEKQNMYPYYKYPTERDIFTMMHNYLSYGDETNIFDMLSKVFATYPNIDSVKKHSDKYDNLLIEYYKKQDKYHEDDSKLDVAHHRHRTYRINQNIDNSCCTICMDDLSGPLFISGCCQSIYHCSCLFNSWDTRFRHHMLTQCPNCRSDPVVNVHTKYISGVNDSIVSSTVALSFEQQLSRIFHTIYKKNSVSNVLWICTPEIYMSVSHTNLKKNLYMRSHMEHTYVEDESSIIEYIDIEDELDLTREIPRIEFTTRKPVANARRNIMQVYILCKFNSYSVDTKSKVWETLTEYLNTIRFDAIIQHIHIPYHLIQLYNDIYPSKIPVYSLEHKRY